jgi:ubiquinone/menaquinone biosynthesis C-methylase UbiE
MGRFSEACIQADLGAVDLSSVVEADARNLGHHRNASFCPADIMNVPFDDKTFDVIYSIRVPHHTTDTRKAFLSLTRLLKPGGRIGIWVYSTRLRLMFGGELFRLVTTHIPKPMLPKVSKLAIPLYYLHQIPVVGKLSTHILPTSLNPDPEWRWLDTFDWYSPRYQWKHTYQEVEGWFREAGLTEIRAEPVPVSVRAVRRIA